MRGWFGWLAGGVAVAILVAFAVVSTGFDARTTPRIDPAVWVERSSGQYARVNTETAEIDTVRRVDSPSDLVQTGGIGMLLTQGFGRAWVIDPADPKDVRDEPGAGGATATPAGTRQVLAAGQAIAYLTESGEVYLASTEHPGETLRLEGQADAIALDAGGRLARFSRSDGGVQWFNARTGEPGAFDPLDGPAADGELQLAIVGDGWALLDGRQGDYWASGLDRPVRIRVQGEALLQGSDAADGAERAVLLADRAGLWSVDAEGRAVRAVDAEGSPARPELSGGEPVAAWIDGNGATVWTAGAGSRRFARDPGTDLPTDPQPVIRTNGDRAVLAELSTGMMWRIPDGRLIPVTQWKQSEPPKESSGDSTPQDVTEQLPPVAVDDRFGVRVGEPVLLQVLLNDHDPNRADVLTVVPEGLGAGLPADFGTVSLLSDAQGVMLEPRADASGTVRFRYRITDGTHLSEPATVTLSVVPESRNSAPQWCPVEGCLRDWPAPQMTPGGTLVLPLLQGWVDPEGDPIALVGAKATGADDPVRTLITEDGRLAIRHTDPNAGEGLLALVVTVADARGATSTRELSVQVTSGATAELPPIASTVRVGETTVLNPLSRVIGGSGSYSLKDAVVQSGAARDVSVRVRPGAGSLEVTADRAGSALIAVTVQDTVTEAEVTGVIRVVAVKQRAPLALPPLRVFVHPFGDTTIDVLASVPSAGTRDLSVRSAMVVDGRLRADVIEHARIRVAAAGTDAGEATDPGRVGAVDVVVADGERVATGRLTVFRAPAKAGSAIAVADIATVRAGSVVDIPVLDNDVSPPGDRLVLSPKVVGSGAKGELVFASGSQVRYLAPTKPGSYTLNYRVSATSNPKVSDVGQIRVTVLPHGTNRAPAPATVTVRLAPGEQATATIPLSGVDPDGDRVRLVGVEQPGNPQLTAAIPPRSSAVRIEASRSATPGSATVEYVVRDDLGAEARGRIHVILTDPDPGGGAPVVYSDYVRLVRGAAQRAVVRPLDNDIDPRGGTLKLTEVVPNVPGGVQSQEYRELAKRLDLSRMNEGIVTVAGAAELGTVSFRYTVRSSRSTSTADGLIVVQVTDSVGAQAPSVTDTVLSVRDRASLPGEGVDVVSGRVQWATGDVADLELSLWGDAARRYTVVGNRIIGQYRAEGDLVVFRLSGPDSSGAEVSSYGFLVIPPLDELRLTLRTGVEPLSVPEGERVESSILDLLDLGPGDRVVLASGALPTQRAQASCIALDGTTLRYSAGAGAPWRDSCTIRVRLVEQRSYTSIPVPIDIVPDAPVAALNPLTRTIAPGGSASVALTDMLEWEGGREGDVARLSWSVAADEGPFEVSPAGSTVRLRARADATPGAEQSLRVTVRGAGASTAVLTLRVAEAARDAPRGGTIALRCTVGEPCTAPLVGVQGEYDPFAGKPGGGLRVVSVDGAGCALGAFALDGDAVRVTWPDANAAGGSCTASFAVRDAQRRTGTGSIELDVLGKPRPPASAKTVAFTENSVTIRVDPGEAQSAHPDLQGITLRQLDTGRETTCTAEGADYSCVVGGLVAGEAHGFVAVAVNRVGESAPSPVVTSWAYRAPSAPVLSFKQVDESTTEDRGTVRFNVFGQDDVRGYRLMLDGALAATFDGRVVDAKTALPVGAHSITAIPISKVGSPIDPSDNLGTGTDPQPITVAGLPRLSAPEHSYDDANHRLVITVAADENYGGGLKYGADLGDGCNPGSNSNTVEIPLNASPGDTVRVTVCARNNWGTSSRTSDITI